MRYFEQLGMSKDPFGPVNDTSFFYPTRGQVGAIKRLELTLRMNGGLNLILGERGTGKTMLSEVIAEQVDAWGKYFLCKLFSKSQFRTDYRLFRELAGHLDISTPCRSTGEYKNAIQDYLFRHLVEEEKTVVIVIDDGHSLGVSGLRDLAWLLGNGLAGSRLVHLVVLGELKLLESVNKIENIGDYLNLVYTLNPLDPEEMKEVILHRLNVAGNMKSRELFDDLALNEIWRLSKGNLMKANLMCLHSLTSMTIRQGRIVCSDTVRSVARDWGVGR